MAALARFALASALTAACLGLCCGGCNSKRGPSIVLRVAGVAGATMRCADPAAVAGDTLGAGSVSKVRVTFRARDAEGKTLDFCDHVFNVPGEPPFLRAPSVGAKAIDIFAEAYGPAQPADPMSANGVRRLSTGALLGVDPNAATLGTLRLYPTERFRCAPARLGQARAFHSATLLPDGRVLFVGGLVGNAGDPTATAVPMAGMTATGAAEIYDPLDQSVTPVTEAAAPTARAFHSAYVTTTSACPADQVAVLVVGGLTPIIPGKAMIGTSRGEQGGRLVPFDMNTIPNPLGAAAAPNEYLCLDAVANTATRVSLAGPAAASFQATDQRGARAIAAGGLDYDATMLNAIVPVRTLAAIDLGGGAVATSMTGATRIGATATFLDDTRALLWGGGGSGDPIGELVSGLDGTPSSTALTVGSTAITQFHTATLLPDAATPTVLVTGGFEITAGGVNTQPPSALSAVRLVTVSGATATPANVGFSGGYMADPACMDPDRYRPAGWESAVALSRGRILVTGGTPSTMTVPASMRCGDCPADTSLICALAQASLFSATTNTIARTAEPLQVARFGHTSTTMPDGTVLVAGGIGGELNAGVTSPVFIADLEVYNPRELLAPFDSVTGIDADDPLVDDITQTQLDRAPGAQATLPNTTQPARDCKTL